MFPAHKDERQATTMSTPTIPAVTTYGEADLSVISLSRVTPVVVTYNSAHCLPFVGDLLGRCPSAILSDNASDDDIQSQANVLLPHATLLRHERNLGFGAANNRALALVKTEFALIINPDCQLSEAALNQLITTADRFPDAAIVGPQIRDADGRDEINYRWVTGSWSSTGPGAIGQACVGYLSGAAMLLRMSVCAPHGFFDERFFLYYEDDDLCRRYFDARLPLILDPEATATHLSRRSVRGRSPIRNEYWRGFHHVQSKLTYAAKYSGPHVARSLRRQLIWKTAAALPLRALFFSPRLIVRMWGRLNGLRHWSRSSET